MRVTLVHNPTAGDEEHGRAWLTEVLEEAGHDVRYQSVDEEGWEAALTGDVQLVGWRAATAR